MPNHVTSICTVTGPAASVAAFVEKHVTPGHPDDSEHKPAFTCESVIPRPKVLDGTISPDPRVRPPCEDWGFLDTFLPERTKAELDRAYAQGRAKGWNDAVKASGGELPIPRAKGGPRGNLG